MSCLGTMETLNAVVTIYNITLPALHNYSLLLSPANPRELRQPLRDHLFICEKLCFDIAPKQKKYLRIVSAPAVFIGLDSETFSSTGRSRLTSRYFLIYASLLPCSACAFPSMRHTYVDHDVKSRKLEWRSSKRHNTCRSRCLNGLHTRSNRQEIYSIYSYSYRNIYR